jgi:hypothetical protein
MSEPEHPYERTPDGWSEPEIDTPPTDITERRLVDPRTLPARIHNLKAAGLSGAHALLSFQGDSPDSLARRLGSGTHAMLTGKPWVPWDQPSKASLKRRADVMKEVRAGSNKPLPALSTAPRSGDDWKKFCVANQGKVILTESEVAKARRMVDAIMLNPKSNALMTGDVIMERSIIWAQNGRARQTTPDVRSANGEYNAEIKTARSVHPLWFKRDAEKFGYHAQLADQSAAIKHETGSAPRHSFIIAVESGPPWIVQVYEALPSTLDKGAQLCEIWLDKLQIYEATGQWSGYSDRIEPWEIIDPLEAAIADPDWMTDKEDDISAE